jgi:hypothetical protein
MNLLRNVFGLSIFVVCSLLNVALACTGFSVGYDENFYVGKNHD